MAPPSSASKSQKPEAPIYEFASVSELEEFLDREHANHEELGFRIQHARKGSGIASINTYEARQVMICFGWIDSFSGGNERGRLVRYTPRREQSNWSPANQEHAQKMIDQGRMRPSGYAKIEEAKKNGKWGTSSTDTKTDDTTAASGTTTPASKSEKQNPSSKPSTKRKSASSAEDVAGKKKAKAKKDNGPATSQTGGSIKDNPPLRRSTRKK